MKRRRRWLLAAPALLLALLLGVGVLSWVLISRQERDLERQWSKALGTDSLLARYPDTERNEAAEELESLGNDLGLYLFHRSGQAVAELAEDRVHRQWEMRSGIEDYLSAGARATAAGLPLPAPPPEFAARLEEIQPDLTKVVAHVLAVDELVWDRHLSRGFRSAPNALGLLWLQRLLLVDAGENLRLGQREQALQILEAVWLLNQDLLEGPRFLLRALGVASLREQQFLLRQLDPLPRQWAERLESTQLRPLAYETILIDGWITLHTVGADGDLTSDGAGRQDSSVWRRLERRTFGSRLLPWLQRIEDQDLHSFDPDSYAEEIAASLPYWNKMGKFMVNNETLKLWPKAARTDLDLELTTLIAEERQRRQHSAGSPPATRPSCVEGFHWIYEPTEEGLLIHLDGTFAHWPEEWPPLQYLLRDEELKDEDLSGA